MKKTKLLKTILIPTLVISTIIPVAIATSCGGDKPTPIVNVTGVSLDKKSVSLNEGATETLKANVLPENATDKSVTWSSSNAEIATVDANGKVTALKKGNATITVKTNDGDYTATCQVTVNKKDIHVTGVSLDKKSVSLNEGATETLKANVLPENATDKSVTWSSSNAEIATVDANGKVTALKKGNATITVKTNDGDYTATCQVTVNKKDIHVTGVTLNKDQTTLGVGDTETLTATISPEEATDKSVTWRSSDNLVATVNQNGEIKAKSLGKTTITVTTNDGGFTDTVHVSVIGGTTDSLIITANADSTFVLINEGGNKPNLQYSKDGVKWTEYAEEKVSILSNETLHLRGNNPTGWSHNANSYSLLRFTGNISVSGNIMALLDNGVKDGDPGNITDIPNDYCFLSLFQDSVWISSVSQNFLPSINLKKSCYKNMFYNCSSLLQTPALPATTLAANCYDNMFSKCTSLTQAPALPATELAEYCYKNMFYNCTSLTQAPALPAISLADWCYYGMFENCNNLVKAPALPATTLAKGCYSSMFKGCKSLTANIQKLSATELASDCYKSMFEDCTSLNNTPELPATTLASGCYESMFEGCIWLTNPLPDLPATELADFCYKFMFKGCTSLETAHDLNAPYLKESCYFGMFAGCTSLTTAVNINSVELAPACFENMFYGCSKLEVVKIVYSGDCDLWYFNNWVSGVADSGIFWYNGNSTPQDFGFPNNWWKSPYSD